jgi:hypothetical protein
LRRNQENPSEEVSDWFRNEFPESDNYTDYSFFEKLTDSPKSPSNPRKIRLISEEAEFKMNG